MLPINDILQELCLKLDVDLIRPLGSGAFKQAFLVQRNGTGEQFALKIAEVTGQLRDRFAREVVALQNCDHPGIARIIHSDGLTYQGVEYAYILEEFLASGTLEQLSANARFPDDKIRSLGRVLASAVAHLAEKAFVHRDIKPANILFRSESQPVLTDFGIVRMLDEVSLTQEFMHQGPGTPLYSAAEQLLNEKASIDWRTDQFGLAIVLAELVLGRHPFASAPGIPGRDTVLRIANREELSDETKTELADRGFQGLIKALSPWPVQRFRFPHQFLASLSGA